MSQYEFEEGRRIAAKDPSFNALGGKLQSKIKGDKKEKWEK